LKLVDYYRTVLVPANVAMSAQRRAGLVIDRDRITRTLVAWDKKLAELEAYVEGEAAKLGVSLKFSEKHAPKAKDLKDFLFGTPGLGLPVEELSDKTGEPSADSAALTKHASLIFPRRGDNPIVHAIMKIRSLAKARETHLLGWLDTMRADSAIHPTMSWALRTSRLSASNPPVHQIPERSDPEVADGVKSCIVPRVSPARTPEEWNPHKHGSCIRWDLAGSEAAIRAAVLTKLFCSEPDPAWEYIRLGKDLHSRTAGLIYDKPEGFYKKGSMERDSVGKVTFFALQYGAKWRTVQMQAWKKARIELSDGQAKKITEAFFRGYPGLAELYERDKRLLGELGYCDDAYGKRRWVGLPNHVTYRDGKFSVNAPNDAGRKKAYYELDNRFHIMSNSPTQSMSATDALWMIALLYHGEYVDLAVPDMWSDHGVDYPEAADWQFHEGNGPGGKPFRCWGTNYVHDSQWLDCAPGLLEPAAKLITRRCRAVPLDWRIEADVPYRIEIKAGPDQGHLRGYNSIAKEFDLEPIPER
jgi:hypothetical protein